MPAVQHEVLSGAWSATAYSSINSANACAFERIAFIFAIALLVVSFVVRSSFA